MPLKFRSLCSGSRGNAALLWTSSTGVLVDFAPGCQRDCRAALAGARELCPGLGAVLVTHAHGDHINGNSLKVLREAGFKVRCHPDVARQIMVKYGLEYSAIIETFKETMVLGDLSIAQMNVDHAPGYRTTAFIINTTAGRIHKACIFTDFCEFSHTHVSGAAGADIIFLEANHDLDLLAKYGHPGSEFHLSNNKAAHFLHQVCSGGAQPKAVILGHLSVECNRPDLPAKEIAAYFGSKSLPVKFDMHIASRKEPGPVIVIK